MVWMLIEEGFGEADGFFAEYEVVASLWGDVVDGLFCSGGEVVGGCGGWGGGLVRFEGIVVGEVESWPVVEARASACFFVDVEGEGVDEVEGCAGGDAGASDGAGVVWDFGVEEDDVGDGVGCWGGGRAGHEGVFIDTKNPAGGVPAGWKFV